MKSKKQNVREQLEAGMAVFLSQGKVITKMPTYGGKRKPKQEEIVEIEVNELPEYLRMKFFKET